MEPLSAGILAGGGLLSGMFGGGDQRDPYGKMHVAYGDPFQGALFQKNIRDFMAGRGDFGFGQAAKQGGLQIKNLMAQRGIRPDSGVGLGLMGNMYQNAANSAAQNRIGYGLQLAGMQPNLITSGHGWDDRPRDLSLYNSALQEGGSSTASPWDRMKPPVRAYGGYGGMSIGGG